MDWTYRLRLRNLKMLLSVAETGNLSQSALALHSTQPALSKWLKELEDDVGLPLFERHARGLKLTPYGEAMIAHARRIDSDIVRASQDMAALREGVSGRVAIGASGASTSDLVPLAIQQLLARMPQARVTLFESTMDKLLARLSYGDVDIVVGRAAESVEDPGVQSESLYLEPIQMVARPKHPLFSIKEKLTWADLMQYRWIVWPQGIPIRTSLDAALAAATQTLPPNSIESNSVMANLMLLNNSDMISVASHRVALRFSQMHAMRIIPIHLFAFGSVGMYWRRDAVQAMAVDAAVECFRTVAAEFTQRATARP